MTRPADLGQPTEQILRADPDQIVHAVLHESLVRMGLHDDSLRRRVVASVFRLALPRFAAIMTEFDDIVATHGFVAGNQWILPYLQMRVSSIGRENVPLDGPVILASNHPGGADFCAIFSQIPRDDGRLVAAVEELKLLPNLQQHIIYTNRTKGMKKRRGATSEKIMQELRDGSCVLLYPRGKMEPDPRWAAGGRANLPMWSSSLTRFAEVVPNLTIVPTVVSGSVSRKALEMGWLNFFKSERYKQRMAVFAQITMSMIRPKRWDVTPLVQFGQPIRVADTPLDAVRPQVLAGIEQLLTHSRAVDWPLRSRTVGWL